jgi:hypothetical protein
MPGTLFLTRLDSGGEPVQGSLVSVALDETPAGLGIACGNASCRIAATTAGAETGGISGFVWRPTGDLRPKRVLSLRFRPRDTVSPAVLGDDLFYSDESQPDSAAVRRLTLLWE